LGLLGVLAFAHPAQADVVSIAPDFDCSYNDRTEATDCSGSLEAGYSGTDAVWREHFWLQFDLAEHVPNGAEIVSAKLRLTGTYSTSTPDPAFLGASAGDPEATEAKVRSSLAQPSGPFVWDLTARARNSVASDLYVELAPVPPTSLVPANWSFASSEALDASTRPVLEVEYLLACPSDPYAAAQSSSASTVYAWNAVLMDAYRFDTAPRPPTRLSRAGAMMHIALFDTLNSVFFAKLEDLATGAPGLAETCGWTSYQVLAETPASTHADLAAGFAARNVLQALFPARSSQVAAAFVAMHGNGPYQAAAQALGQHVASRILTARANDGAGASMSYTPASSTPGAWRPTPTLSTEAPCTSAVSPGWGNVAPFALTSASQFRQPLPGGYSTYSSLLASSFYANQVNEVKAKGRAPRSTSTRTVDEEHAAWFWANDLDLTYKPPGQLLQHTREVAQTQPAAQTTGDPATFFKTWSQQGIRVSRLFAEVSIAMADAAIAAWDQKYLTPIDLWRPSDAIHGAGTDGNSATINDDPNWQPLSADRNDVSFSPCFPAWVSGHATFGGAWSRVMENEFRDAQFTSPFPLTLTTEDPHAVRMGDTDRVFASFAQAGEENALSRIWLGVHYRVDAVDGVATGRQVADQVNATKLRWRQKCANWSCTTPIN
jgi:hypothetical protein